MFEPSSGLAGAVARLAAAVAGLPLADVGSLAAEDVDASMRQVDGAIERLTALRLRLVRFQRDGGRWRGHGDRSYEAFRGRTTGGGERAARAQTRLADAARTVPAAGQALDEGRITVEHLATIARVVDAPGRSARVAAAIAADDGGQLVALARRMDAGRFAKEAQRWAARLDQDAVETEFQRVRARRYLRVVEGSGGVRLDGLLDPVAGHTVRLALEAATARPAAEDVRSSDQRRADALTELCAAALASGDSKAGALVRPHVSVLVREDTWVAARRRALRNAGDGPAGGGAPAGRAGRVEGTFTRSDAWGPAGQESPAAHGQEVDPTGMEPAGTEDGTLLPPSVFDQLLCDCTLTRVVLGADSEPLDVGRAQRSFSRQVRRAVIARDRHCRWPSCERPARWAEVHHIRFWRDGGRTSTDNGVTLCSYHHHEVHRGTARIERLPGGHRFVGRGGRLIGDSLREAPESRPSVTPDRPPSNRPPSDRSSPNRSPSVGSSSDEPQSDRSPSRRSPPDSPRSDLLPMTPPSMSLLVGPDGGHPTRTRARAPARAPA